MRFFERDRMVGIGNRDRERISERRGAQPPPSSRLIPRGGTSREVKLANHRR